MSETTTRNGTLNSPSFRFPRLTVAWTLFAICTVAALAYFSGWLNEQQNIPPGMVNVLQAVLFLITGVSWLAWLAFFSGIRGRFLWATLCLALVALFFYNYRLILDGDLGFVRIESRFLQRQFEPLGNGTGQMVDLSQTGPYDFNQFLGPNRNATLYDVHLNGNWDDHPPQLVWKQPIGDGWSGFAAVNGLAVTQEQRGQDECVTCYDIRSGELKWIYAAPRRHEDTMSLGKVGPRATPTIDQGRVYCQGATGVLDCLDGSDGSLIWSVDLPDLLNIELEQKTSSKGFKYQYEKSSLAWGRSGSPLVIENKVVVTGGGPRDGPFATLLAFDKQSGQELWRGGERMIGYGSPGTAQLLDGNQITLVAESSAMGFDPTTGNVLWSSSREGASDQDANCSQVTVISDNRILLSKGYQLGGQMVELSRDGNGIEADTIWQNPRVLKTKFMSPVIKDGHAYSLSDGFLECSDIRDDQSEGRRVWRKRGRFGNGQLLLVGNYLLVHTENGVLKLIEASPDVYRELGEIETIDGVCWNTLCLYDRFLLVRSELEAACFELSMEDPIDSESGSGATAIGTPDSNAQQPR